jgi:Xaa-Pro dipeptidase
MVLTVEPGCYFNDVIIENAYKNPEISPYLIKEKIEEYKEIGGVR